jgi:hypothetical protein
MIIIELDQKPLLETNFKYQEGLLQFEKLLSELRKKELPDGLVNAINKDIEALNASSGSGDEQRKSIKKIQMSLIKLIEKEVKLVPKNYYRNLWLTLGMAAFGIPLGAAFGASLGNMAFLGIGLPIGMAVGSALGSGMDKKALAEGRQLDIEIKY